MRAVLAVAACSLRDLTRRPGPWFLLGTVGLLALMVPRWAGEEATLPNRLRFAAAYGVGLPAFLTTAFVLVLAASAIARDVQSRRIQTVLTKPCACWQLVLGKLLAIAGVAALLLLLVFGAFALHAATSRASGADAGRQEEAALLSFFTPRVALPPRAPEIDPEVVRRYVAQLREEGRHASESRRDLEERARRSLRFLRVEPSGSATLVFDGVTPGEYAAEPGGRDVLVLRLEVQSSPLGARSRVDCVIELRAEGDPASAVVRHAQIPVGVPWDVLAPAADLPPTGPLAVTIRNPASDEGAPTLLLDPLRAELRLPYGSFWAGVARAFGLLLVQTVLLVAVTLLASAIFSFPTANLVGFFVYGTGLAAGFLRDTFYRELVEHRPGVLQWLSTALSRIGRFILSLLPDLTEPDVVERLAEAQAIPLDLFVRECCTLIFLQGGVVFLATAFLLSRRELARGDDA